jgi:hypothetical protein
MPAWKAAGMGTMDEAEIRLDGTESAGKTHALLERLIAEQQQTNQLLAQLLQLMHVAGARQAQQHIATLYPGPAQRPNPSGPWHG